MGGALQLADRVGSPIGPHQRPGREDPTARSLTDATGASGSAGGVQREMRRLRGIAARENDGRRRALRERRLDRELAAVGGLHGSDRRLLCGDQLEGQQLVDEAQRIGCAEVRAAGRKLQIEGIARDRGALQQHPRGGRQ